MGSSDAAVDAWEALFRAQVSIMRDLRDDFSATGMSINEYDVLFNIVREPDHRVRLRDLNRSVLITQSSVSRLIDRLAERGLVEKSNDPDDARGTIAGVTRRGRAEFARVAKVHMRNIRARVGDVLDTDELAQLQAICTKLLVASPACEMQEGDPTDEPAPSLVARVDERDLAPEQDDPA
ncbi:MarR family transcriptional regulator [Pseudoclavibacter endophyticus]|uniref:Winged helix-turn-helix transcriptional regulator n=1 Tax=Pseudoclavibacter endophyticus TaxID=1778590 RepID=A0A6H9WD79_9MICO|nr:MarR family winged helix-turn-helix transcriptional regulator [Pseudoclavibacter endophyticus]KAB1648912.1 winged helix-turn-helix transcriptional regulator [Pseudoclavibacter endophyticus]GGA67305.1 MarR family transcriptional regulator [Pseudoclavibacter endophyticus]